jgi:hypothetical protein
MKRNIAFYDEMKVYGIEIVAEKGADKPTMLRGLCG